MRTDSMKIDYRITKEDSVGDPEYMVAALPIGSLPDYYPTIESEYVVIPERIMWLIIGIAKTYNLSFSNHVSSNQFDRWVYRGAQIEALENELEFIFNLLNDEFVKESINSIQSILRKTLSKKNKLELAFEGP